MKTFVDYMVENTAAQSKAKSKETRKVLVAMVNEKIGWRAPRGITMKELRTILSQ